MKHPPCFEIVDVGAVQTMFLINKTADFPTKKHLLFKEVSSNKDDIWLYLLNQITVTFLNLVGKTYHKSYNVPLDPR